MFDLTPDQLGYLGSLLSGAGQGFSQGGVSGLLGGAAQQGGAFQNQLQAKQMAELRKRLMQGGGLLGGGQQMVGKPMGLMGSAPLAPWGGGQY